MEQFGREQKKSWVALCKLEEALEAMLVEGKEQCKWQVQEEVSVLGKELWKWQVQEEVLVLGKERLLEVLELLEFQ